MAGHSSLADIRSQLEDIHSSMHAAERRFLAEHPDLPPDRLPSALNLLHYLTLRRRDLRAVQAHLADIGLSSLGRAESQTLASVEAVIDLLARLDGLVPPGASLPTTRSVDARARLDWHTRALFGDPPAGRDVRIMVTMPGEAADDPRLIRDLLASGMDCLRINASHDSADAWERMVAHLSRANAEVGRPCRVLIDLAGPRIRTGAVEPGPPVVRWRPERDACGRVLRAARIWLTDAAAPQRAPDSPAASLPVGGGWLAELAPGDTVTFTDARDKKRELTVVARGTGGVWAECAQTAYVLPGTRLRRRHRDGDRRDTEVSDLPHIPQSIVLKPGDTLMLVRDELPGRPAVTTPDGQVIEPACIGVSLPAIFDDALPGQSIWFDDGRIGGSIRAIGSDRLEVQIVHAAPQGSKLGAEKGINLPDTDLRLPPLTPKDRDDLPFIASHADIIGYSFVRTAEDVEALRAQLATLGRREPGLILKIETRRAFEQLPSLLLAAMKSPASGVMIARGDLAVECGFERLAEAQEEILWMAEASHTPVIWATQVLESLTRDGLPSRAEVIDAAMGERAECVMLNKGPHVLESVRTLDNILSRMQAHQHKKSPMLRQLGLADRFFERGELAVVPSLAEAGS